MLKDKINEDFKTAFKAKDEAVVSVLKMLKASLLNKEKEKEYQANKQGKDAAAAALTEEDIIDAVSAEIKKLRDSSELFAKGGRNDLADQAKKEVDILLRYLPKQLEEEEIKKIVADAVAQAGASSAKDIGKVMALLMPKVKGKADCALVVKLAKEALG